MRVLIHNIKKLFDKENIKQMSEELILIFKEDSKSIDPEADYEVCEQLFLLDLFLTTKSNALWKSISIGENLLTLPKYLQDLIKTFSIKPIANVAKLRGILEGYKDVKSFQYLIARCLIVEGVENGERSKIEEGEKILESLAWQTERDLGDPSNYDQLMNARGDALIQLSQLVSLNEAIECVDKISDLQIGGFFFNPLYIYRASLITINHAKRSLDEKIEQGKKDLDRVIDSYQSKNMEILSIFMAIAAFIFGVGGIVYKGNSLNDQLILLGVLSLSIVTVFSAMISMIRFKWLTLFIYILALIISPFCGYFFLMKNSNVNFSQELIVQNSLNSLQTKSKLDGSVKERVY